MTDKNNEIFRSIYRYCYDTFSDWYETRIQMFSRVVCVYKVKSITPFLFSTTFVYDFSRPPGSTRVRSFVVKKKHSRFKFYTGRRAIPTPESLSNYSNKTAPDFRETHACVPQSRFRLCREFFRRKCRVYTRL